MKFNSKANFHQKRQLLYSSKILLVIFMLMTLAISIIDLKAKTIEFAMLGDFVGGITAEADVAAVVNS